MEIIDFFYFDYFIFILII